MALNHLGSRHFEPVRAAVFRLVDVFAGDGRREPDGWVSS